MDAYTYQTDGARRSQLIARADREAEQRVQELANLIGSGDPEFNYWLTTTKQLRVHLTRPVVEEGTPARTINRDLWTARARDLNFLRRVSRMISDSPGLQEFARHLPAIARVVAQIEIA